MDAGGAMKSGWSPKLVRLGAKLSAQGKSL